MNFEFGYDITILKMAIFYKDYYIEIEAALPLTTLLVRKAFFGVAYSPLEIHVG